MAKVISKARMKRYMLLRLLFRCQRDFDELMRESGLSKIKLVNTLIYLQTNRLLKKEKNEKGMFYALSLRGENRLAYFEYHFQLYQRWRPKWCIGEDNGWDDSYCNEVTDLIKKLNYFGSNYVME